MYISGDDSFESYASQTSSEDFFQPPKGKATAFQTDRTFVNHDTNISVRSDYNRADYDYFRPSDRTPTRQREIIGMAMEAYQKVGLIRNVIDLMSDFGSQGIRVQHTTPSVQKFYSTWWEKVNGAERSERFLNLLYRCGQNIIRKNYGKVSQYQERKMRKGVAKEDIKLEKVKTNPREIPLKYNFVNPLNVEIMAEDLSQFVGQPALGLRISTKLRNAVRMASSGALLSPEVKKLINKIPSDVFQAIQNGAPVLPLDMDKTEVYYYKKDDWSVWANPMCYCILDDLLMLNKLKLADISALDGAISNIRLWKLGFIGDSPSNSILPTKTSLNKLRNILSNNVGGGVLDLVWGPELSFEESNSQVWRWLGSEKYTITLNNIYEGMGIPTSLQASSSGSTNTGNFVGLNTLVKRLKYGRDLLVSFWNNELKYIHKAMGFPGKPPVIVFDYMVLADEAAEKQLLINMWDRNIISDETILELFGREPLIEKSRVSREENERTHEKMPYKASPFHNPDKEHDYRKILLQGGGVAPSEIGIDLNDRKEGEQTRLEQMVNLKDNKQDQPAGRPPNVKETDKRKPKPTEKPSTKASFINTFLWANSAQNQISDILIPSLLSSLGKKNLRSLSKEEFDQIEIIKFNVLCGFKPFDDITTEKIVKNLEDNSKPNDVICGMFQALKQQFKSQNNREPKVDELRQIYSSSYALFHEE